MNPLGRHWCWLQVKLRKRQVLLDAFSSLPCGILSIKTPLSMHSFLPNLGLFYDCFDQWNLEEVMLWDFWAQGTFHSALSHQVRCLSALAVEKGHVERSWGWVVTRRAATWRNTWGSYVQPRGSPSCPLTETVRKKTSETSQSPANPLSYQTIRYD